MKMIRLAIAATFVFGAFSNLWAEDEESSRGRLADGRAFRTDAQGNQLVDYIAELELSVEQLKRRVNGLEFELSEKQTALDRVAAGKGESKVVAERDLFKGKELKPEAPVAGTSGFTSPQPKERASLEALAATCPEQPKCPEVGADAACSHEVASLRQLLEKARFDADIAQKVADKGKSELERTQALLTTKQGECEASLGDMRAKLAKPVCPSVDCSTDVRTIAQQLSQSRAELTRTQQLLSIAQAEQGNQNKALKDVSAQLAKAEARAENSEAQLAAMRTQVTSLQQQVSGGSEEIKGKAAQLEQFNASFADLRAKLESAQIRELALNAQIAELKSKATAVLAKAESKEMPDNVQVVNSKPVVEAKPEVKTAKTAQPQFFGDRSSAEDESRASFSSAKMRAVDTLRGVMTTELHNLRDLVATRDGMYQSFNQSGRPLTFKLSALVSTRNYNMTWIADRIRNATNVYELSNLSRDIRDIRARVQDDIELIKRMKRAG